MRTSDLLKAWRKILKGESPSLSIEITRECPLRCPGCYAYDPAHLGGEITLRDLNDRKGDALVSGVLEVVDRFKPLHLSLVGGDPLVRPRRRPRRKHQRLHLSLVGGDPLVRYRELEVLVPQLLQRDIHVQIVTSAFRPLPPAWAGLANLSIAVSIDGLAPEHDKRRAPATYARILKNIEGQNVTIHCTVTGPMMRLRPEYLAEFLAFWTPKPEIKRVWFSLFTPQIGDQLEEMLTSEERRRAINEMLVLRRKFPKLDMPERLIRQFDSPPSGPADCVFAQTTTTISADLRTEIGPCQFGGNPDCANCGCMASMGLAAIASAKVWGLIPVGALFRASMKIGQAFGPGSIQPELRILQ